MIGKAHFGIPIILIKRHKEKIFSENDSLNKSNEGIIPELFLRAREKANVCLNLLQHKKASFNGDVMQDE
ncbi:hypothetical protein AK966_00290 [Vibrio sp. PID23_8]|nr:hypothetical protein AK966_00290 [Vibrio sp. PID23_8]